MQENYRGMLSLHVVEARGLTGKDVPFLPLIGRNYNDPWLEALIENKTILVTVVHCNTSNPKFNVKTNVPYNYSSHWLTIRIYDCSLLKSKLIGQTKISLLPLNESWQKEKWFPLDETKADVFMAISFKPYEGPQSLLSPEPLGSNFYFPARKGGSLTLYQDAHTSQPQGFDSMIFREAGRDCFLEMYETFNNARKFIYICGWSLWTELVMCRNQSTKETLGELLVRKSEQGVTVLILIWNEKFSARTCTPLFGTHDSQTVKYFADTKVDCLSVRRTPLAACSKKEAIFETIYTHHMKFLLADDDEKGLIGFIGGIDLTDGRWDFPDHPIWETLVSFHGEDFYNGFAEVTKETGPREPWHDAHSKVDGPAAFDLLCAFEERWKRHGSKLVSKLVPFTLQDIHVADKDENELTWNLQVLRTCDSDSSVFEHKSPNLNDFEGHQKDVSVEHGYVNLIRSTRKFMYIENQYFLGSSYEWEGNYSSAAQTVVPAEIVQQIIYGIKNNTPIRVYIVIPLAPEGDATSSIGSAYMADILLWQFLTLQMMYRKIGLAIHDAGADEHPEDFLLVLFLGKKHSKESAAKKFPDAKVIPNSIAAQWQQKRRFLVYVHSKMALADDSRIIIGSANLNQRSLDGSRDTEAAIAGSQVRGDGDEETIVTDGEVGRFRKSLWFEHTEGESAQKSVYSDPSSLECIRYIRQKSEQALRDYTSDEYDNDLRYRFIKYPLLVEKDGTLSALPDFPTIPDFDIPVVGKKSFIPTNVTT